MNDFGSLVIIGALTSLITQFLKNRFGTQGYYTLVIVFLLSLVSGVFYYFAKKNTNFLETCLQILTVAGATYSYVLSRFDAEKKPVSSPPNLEGEVKDEKTDKK